MEIIIQPTPEEATKIAARIIARLLSRKPNAVLGLATGGTPQLLYQELVTMNLNWSRVKTFNIDEYAGLPENHPQSFHSFMRENLFRHIKIPARNIHIPDGNARDVEKFCETYEKQIRAAHGIDLQVLGIGGNGHIGFNEPMSSLASRTRIKTLTRQTIRDNARFFGSRSNVPRHVITMGIGTIMEARQIILLAFGAKKSGAVASAIEGPIAARHPASALQQHPHVTICLDDAAASKLEFAGYYRETFRKKPAWQR